MTSKIFTFVLTLCLVLSNGFQALLLSMFIPENDNFRYNDGDNFIISQRLLETNNLSTFSLIYNSYFADEMVTGIDTSGAYTTETVANFDNTNENIKEWKLYFQSATDDEIYDLVYDNNLQDKIEFYLKANIPFPQHFNKNNKAVNQIIANQDYEWLDYIQFANKCLKYVGWNYQSYDSYWYESYNQSLYFKDYATLIFEAKKGINSVKNEQLKQRYAFQICRLTDYYSANLMSNKEEEDVHNGYENQEENRKEITENKVVLDTAVTFLDAEKTNTHLPFNNYFESENKKEEVLPDSVYLKVAQFGKSVFEKYLANSKSAGMIREWSRAHYAKLLYRLNQQEDAALENARAFANCPSKRRCTKTAMKYNIAIWEKLKAENKLNNLEDNLNLRALIALDQLETNVDDLIYIAENDASHFMIPLLLLRELKKAENAFNLDEYSFTYDENYERIEDSKREKLIKEYQIRSKNQAEKLQKFCLNIKSTNNTYYNYLFRLSAGYLSYHLGNYVDAEKIYKNAFDLCQNQIQKDQTRMLILLSKVSSTKIPTPVFENELLTEFKWLDTCKALIMSAENTKVLALNKLKTTYKSNSLMQYFLDASLHYVSYDRYPEVNKLETLATFLSNNSHTRFQTYISSKINITLDEIYDIRATVEMGNGNFELALKYFDKVKDKNIIKNTSSDPFQSHFLDFGWVSDSTYDYKLSKVEYAQEMIKLLSIEKVGKANFDTYLKLANGFYNTTYYGANYRLLDYDKCSTEPNYDTKNTSDISYFDCSKALKYYLKALNTSKDKNQQALCVFMAAKCEQKNNWANEKKKPSEVYFKMLSSQYKNTWVNNYAQELCSYYYLYCHND